MRGSEKLGAAAVGGPITKGEGGEAYGLGLTHWGEAWVVNETGSLPDALPTLLGVANPELRQTLAAG